MLRSLGLRPSSVTLGNLLAVSEPVSLWGRVRRYLGRTQPGVGVLGQPWPHWVGRQSLPHLPSLLPWQGSGGKADQMFHKETPSPEGVTALGETTSLYPSSASEPEKEPPGATGGGPRHMWPLPSLGSQSDGRGNNHPSKQMREVTSGNTPYPTPDPTPGGQDKSLPLCPLVPNPQIPHPCSTPPRGSHLKVVTFAVPSACQLFPQVVTGAHLPPSASGSER